ncbi:hypothetical protein KUL72_06875 [Bradyrhizobium arachidis]|uniref:hypothetical protein n=1 Tax=Bradyrhizobium arachidis TaxID=858423 RepID=UPI002161F118|nr:hypothetical protein [Bradyrhizobium arachidis]UVO38094.1 hypothetical protein KUL72_06875 [Bradyrhizobium arachidis]
MSKSLNRRLTVAEEAVRKTKRGGVEIVTIVGCLPQPLMYAESGGRGWRREATETYEQFESRAVSEAHAAGLKRVVIGGLPPDFLDPGSLERFLARCDFPEVPPEETA